MTGTRRTPTIHSALTTRRDRRGRRRSTRSYRLVGLLVLAVAAAVAPAGRAAADDSPEPNQPPVITAPAVVTVGDTTRDYEYFPSFYGTDPDGGYVQLGGGVAPGGTYTDYKRSFGAAIGCTSGIDEQGSSYLDCFADNEGELEIRPAGVTYFYLSATDDEGDTTYATVKIVPTAFRSFAVLGDSYASGEGNPAFDPGTDARAVPTTPGGPSNTNTRSCHRSPKAWGRTLMQQRFDLVSFGVFACSGATTATLTQAVKGYPAQITRLQRLQRTSETGEPATVMLTIGGNDIGFADVIAACRLQGRTSACAAATAQARQLSAEVLPGRLQAAYAAVRAAAPNAEIVVVGYPNVMSALGRSASDRCPWITIANRRALAGVATGLDRSISSVVAQTPNARYVSTLTALQGHELCSEAPWVNPITITPASLADGTYVYSAHPNRYGQDAIRRTVAASFECQLVDGCEVGQTRPTSKVAEAQSTSTVAPAARAATAARR